MILPVQLQLLLDYSILSVINLRGCVTNHYFDWSLFYLWILDIDLFFNHISSICIGSVSEAGPV